MAWTHTTNPLSPSSRTTTPPVDKYSSLGLSRKAWYRMGTCNRYFSSHVDEEAAGTLTKAWPARQSDRIPNVDMQADCEVKRTTSGQREENEPIHKETRFPDCPD
ncbi:unnamed protein product [Ectocarpus sp. 4 AP-2014]